MVLDYGYPALQQALRNVRKLPRMYIPMIVYIVNLKHLSLKSRMKMLHSKSSDVINVVCIYS